MNIEKISPLKNYDFKASRHQKPVLKDTAKSTSEKNRFNMEALSFLGKTIVRENAFDKKYKELEKDFEKFGLSTELERITPPQSLAVRNLDSKIIEKLDTLSFYRILQLQKFDRGEEFIETLNRLSPESKEFLFEKENVKQFPTLIYDEDNLNNSIKNIKIFDKLFDAEKLKNIPPIMYDIQLILFLSGQEEDNSDTDNRPRIQQLISKIPEVLKDIG